MCRGAYIPYFKINTPSCYCPLFFKEYLNHLVKIIKMINKHTVNYHPSLSGLTSKINTLYMKPYDIIWLYELLYELLLSYEFLRGSSLWKVIVEFFLKRVYSTIVGENFIFIMLGLLKNAFVSQKIESFHFYLWPQAKLAPRFLSPPPSHKETTIFPRQGVL